MCANRVQTLRSSAPGVLPQAGTRQPGELFLNFADFALGFIDAAQTAQKLLAVRWFVPTASYAVGDFVLQGGNLYRAIAPSSAGAFVAANWSKVGTAADLTAMQAYVDAGDAAANANAATKLPLAGGTLSGPLILSGDPTMALGAATKQYADTKLALAGGTMTGALILLGPPTQNLQAATKAYVDSGAFLPIGGGTMLGPIVLAADPAAALQPATKQYADANYSGFVNRFRNGTMDVWQRSLGSISCPAGALTYTADGWQVTPIGAASTAQAGARMARGNISLQANGAAGVSQLLISQRIESIVAAPIAGRTVTLQATIQNNSGAAITPQFYTAFPTSGDNFGATTIDINNTNLQSIANGATATVAYTFNVSASAINGYQVVFVFSALTSGNVRLADCDIRVTPGWPVGLCANPPPPELRHVQAERAFCQRYYYQNNSLYQNGYGPAGSISYYPVFWKSTMRTAPTVALSNLNYANGSAGNVTNIALDLCVTYLTITSTGNAAMSGTITASAEL